MNQDSRELLHNLRCDVPCSVTLTEEEWNMIEENIKKAVHFGSGERQHSDIEYWRKNVKGWKVLEE